jgi:hypothetical protein
VLGEEAEVKAGDLLDGGSRSTGGSPFRSQGRPLHRKRESDPPPLKVYWLAIIAFASSVIPGWGIAALPMGIVARFVMKRRPLRGQTLANAAIALGLIQLLTFPLYWSVKTATSKATSGCMDGIQNGSCRAPD